MDVTLLHGMLDRGPAATLLRVTKQRFCVSVHIPPAPSRIPICFCHGTDRVNSLGALWLFLVVGGPSCISQRPSIMTFYFFTISHQSCLRSIAYAYEFARKRISSLACGCPTFDLKNKSYGRVKGYCQKKVSYGRFRGFCQKLGCRVDVIEATAKKKCLMGSLESTTLRTLRGNCQKLECRIDVWGDGSKIKVSHGRFRG